MTPDVDPVSYIWWTAAECAETLRLSVKQFRRVANELGFPAKRVLTPTRTVWRADEIQSWADRQAVHPTVIPEFDDGLLGPARPHGPMRRRAA